MDDASSADERVRRIRRLLRSVGGDACAIDGSAAALVPAIACEPVPGDGGVPLGASESDVIFYVIGERIGDEHVTRAIRAYLSTFTQDDPVVLIVRTTGEAAAVTQPMIEVAHLVGAHVRPAAVQLEPHEWEPARTAGLHTRGDCYLATTDDPNDLHALDAATYGNPIVPCWDADRMREVATDLPRAQRAAQERRSQVRAEHSPAAALTALREVPGVDVRSTSTPAAVDVIPRVVHFVFGLRDEAEPFHLVHELAIRSCLEAVAPDEIHVHCGHVPSGAAWARVADRLVIHSVDPDAARELRYTDPTVQQYSYAHQADFVRLDVLAEHGGVYADLDTLFVAPIPDELWRHPFVIGREADVLDGSNPLPRPALSNSLLMATPDSEFLAAWRDEMPRAFDGSWARHSCFLADDLAARIPSAVHVEGQRTFQAFEPSVAGLALLLEHPPPTLDGIVSLHLAAHLWWSEHRLDFSPVHAGMIDEDWIRTSASTYATCARRFLRSDDGVQS